MLFIIYLEKKITTFVLVSINLIFQGYTLQIGMVIGVIMSQPWALGSRDKLPLLFALPSILPLAMLAFTPFLRETPSYMIQQELSSEGKKGGSYEALRALRHSSLPDRVVKDEYDLIKDEIMIDAKVSVWFNITFCCIH